MRLLSEFATRGSGLVVSKAHRQECLCHLQEFRDRCRLDGAGTKISPPGFLVDSVV
jgi:hypothetical protein